MNKMQYIREILPYVREFHGKTFIVKIGGEVCEDENLDEIASQLSLIHHIGIKMVIVHGGSSQMDALLTKLGVERKVIAGRRITDDQTLKAAKMVFAGEVSTNIIAALRSHGAKAVGLTGVDGNLITAHKRPLKEVVNEQGKKVKIDFGNVGDIDDVDTALLDVLLKSSIIPVICSLGADNEGNVYNINADTIASMLAQKLKADKLMILTNVPGILRDRTKHETLVSYADVDTLKNMIRKGQIAGGMLPKVEVCIEAVQNGVHRTHIIDGTHPGALLEEIFVNEGSGTMIVSTKEKNAYEKLKAQHHHVAGKAD
ncbi:acetylglutamate kinase [Candidatus Woesearchaeota archaeon]|nr:acetylglutamate kinase [Candidatus Woesearchaeota archaeon]